MLTARARFILWVILVQGVPHASVTAVAEESVTTRDLVHRSQIPLAVMSQDGRYAAYLLLSGDPVDDVYDMTVRVADTQQSLRPVTLSHYRLKPRETLGEGGALLPGAGDLQWISNDQLVFTVRGTAKTNVMVWNASSQQTRLVMTGHDLVAFDLSDASDSRFEHGTVRLTTTDFVGRPIDPAKRIPDNVWRMEDAYHFDNPLENPKTGHWSTKRSWTITLNGREATATPAEEVLEGWDSAPKEFKEQKEGNQAPDAASAGPLNEHDSIVLEDDDALSPDGHTKAIVEEHWLNLTNPDASYSAFGLVLRSDGTRKVLIPPTGDRRPMTLLSWSRDGKQVYYLNREPQESSLRTVNVDGRSKALVTSTSELSKPGRFFGRSNWQAMSADRRYVLLIRSSNLVPDELTVVDLRTGKLSVLDSPNESFAHRPQPTVRFYSIDGTNGGSWGRLYLPLGYESGKHYPLVITQYVSSTGYYASVGDEVPIVPLTANGISVFAMHSANLNHVKEDGDFRAEISRVERPLKGMQWLIQQLAKEGVVDSNRVGLTGLSYGAEIAMYAYWKSNSFRAISVASAGLDPFYHLLLGPDFSSWWNSRGLPWPDEAGIQKWRALAAGLNARPGLPPLLIQSGDAEEPLTVPTWTRLRSVAAPVDWLEYPHEGHEKVSPANKWWVYERNLDWFRFWLKGEEDSDPAKQSQYARWRQFRESQDASIAEAK